MPPKYHKTSETDFEVFKASCERYIRFFGVSGWEISFAHNDKHPLNRATTEAELGPRHVCFTLTKSKWSYKPTERELKLLGFHEAVELLLFKLQTYADERHPVGDLSDIVHEVVHMLENSVFNMVESQNLTTFTEQ